MEFKIRVLNTDDVPDAVGDTFDPNGIELRQTVYVCLGTDLLLDQVVGRAQLVLSPDKKFVEAWVSTIKGVTMADIEELFPSVVGLVSAKEGARVSKCEITLVALHESRNADPRILRIRDQLGQTQEAQKD